MTDQGTLGGFGSIADGINASGQVVGESATAANAATHAFLYSGGIMTDLGTLTLIGEGESVANGINASGQVVGASTITGNGFHAFLYSGNSMTDLNSLLPAGSGWELLGASAINDSGQIVGIGSIKGVQHAFLMNTDSPEPGSLALLSIGLVAGCLGRWLRPREHQR
jgi:probable HAF family extracellular repeat protein